MTDHIDNLLTNVAGLTFAREARYTCLRCKDTGLATIWKPETIRAAQADNNLFTSSCT